MRMLHTMIRVGDLQKSIDFYADVLGMKLLRKKDYPDGKFTLAFVGYGDEAEHTVIELTYNWDTDHYDLGEGYGHIAIEVDDCVQACVDVRNRGGTVTYEAVPLPGSDEVIAFVSDPDGYSIELIERPK